MAELGFIGLGIMGKPMAGHLLAAGHTVHVHNRSQGAVEELALKGALACRSGREVAQKSDIIFTIVPDTSDVAEVLFGRDGVAEGLKPGSIVVDMSTISPTATREFAEKLDTLGAKMLDAPVSGGQGGAEKAILSIMVGGQPEVFQKVKHYFEIMGRNIVYIGGNGDGQTCKLANQIVVTLTIEAVSEALVFASKAGLDPARVRSALLGGSAQSRILELHGERMIKRNFAPGFYIRLQQKDLNLALQTARGLGVSLPNTATAQELYDTVTAEGGGELDHAAMLLALEKLAGHKVG